MLTRRECLNSYISILSNRLAFRAEFCERGKPLFSMKSRLGLLLAVPALIFFSTAAPQPLQAKSDAEQICVSVGRLLEEGHYTHQPLNNEVSRKLLQTIWSCSTTVIFFSHSRILTRSVPNIVMRLAMTFFSAI